jgi:hypothetical protein
MSGAKDIAIFSESQTGKKSADWAVRTIRTATWQGRTIMMMWQFDDVVHFRWMIVGISDVDTCSGVGK